MNLRKLQQDRLKSMQKIPITGKHILLTGRIPKFTRTTIEKKIKELGGTITDSASYSVDIVVYTRTDTSKYQTAQKFSRCSNTNKMQFVTGDVFVKQYLGLDKEEEDEIN